MNAILWYASGKWGTKKRLVASVEEDMENGGKFKVYT